MLRRSSIQLLALLAGLSVAPATAQTNLVLRGQMALRA
jgi:hypothetical protein